MLLCGSRTPLFTCAEKQTFEFNVRVRAEFKKTVRARMGALLAAAPLRRLSR